MTGSGVHEVPRSTHKCKELHMNPRGGRGIFGPNVTNADRKTDRELHWYMRALETGCDQLIPKHFPVRGK